MTYCGPRPPPLHLADCLPLQLNFSPLVNLSTPLFDMNSLYTLGVRQTNSIQADLERLRNGDTSASLLGLHYIQDVWCEGWDSGESVN